MAELVRRIGLSLGADICWPLCFEGILDDLELDLRLGNDRIRILVERLTIEPFNLRQDCRFDVLLDRLTHWYHTSREWIKKAVLMDDLYVFNNPWSLQSMEKHTSYCAMIRLGMPIPKTWLLPPKEYEGSPDLETTLDYLRARLGFRQSDRIEWNLYALYQTFKSEDWALQGVTPDALPLLLSLGATPYDDEQVIVGLGFRYKMGGKSEE